jgi:N-acetylglutamate synthase-like GNAT family acetyltransferase
MGPSIPSNATDWEISTDKSRLDRGMIHAFLSTTYWANGISRELVDRSIDHSFCFGVYHGGNQIAFARVITDFATFGYLADVFVTETFQGRGISKELVNHIVNHPELRPMRRLMLATMDAQELYEKFGFGELAHPERFMEKRIPNAYGKQTAH